MSCCVPFCLSKKTKSTFGVPKDSKLLKVWEDILGLSLKPHFRVCINHFDAKDIKSEWVSGEGVNKYTICLKKPTLKSGTTPKKIKFDNGIENGDYTTIYSSSSIVEDSKKFNPKPLPKIEDHFYVQHDHCYNSKKSPDFSTVSLEPTNLFKLIYNDLKMINLPKGWFIDVGQQFGLKDEPLICLHKPSSFRENFQRIIEKQIVLTKDLNIIFHVQGKMVAIEDIGIQPNYKPTKIEDFEYLLTIYNSINMCEGTTLPNEELKNLKSTFGQQFIECFGVWRHQKCKILLNTTEIDTICTWCKRLKYCIKNKKIPKKNKNLLLTK